MVHYPLDMTRLIVSSSGIYSLVITHVYFLIDSLILPIRRQDKGFIPLLFTLLPMFKLMSYVQVPFRTSNAIKSLEVDLLRQKARTVFKNGKGYEYGNVSKRAIANVLFNPDVSLGFWVNNNLVNSERTREIGHTTNVTRSLLEAVLKKPDLPCFA